MPELPEVETIARKLRDGGGAAPPLVGRTIAGARLLWERTLAEPSPAEFKVRIKGQRIEETGRRGKYLLLRLSLDTLLLHLRMSGDILVGEGREPLGSHPRLVLYMENGLQLAFNDTRKFGRVWLVTDPESVLAKLGPEPFDPALTAEAFHALLQGRKRQIKPLLLDQGFLAGVGNIYADEALHLAKIHPTTPANLIEPQETARLLEAVRAVLREGIRRSGASIDWVYRGGDYQNHFRVYQREGEPCLECGTPIARTVVAQRGTHYCPTCQAPRRA